MKKYIALFLVAFLFLFSALPVFGSAVDVGIARVVYLVNEQDGGEIYRIIYDEATVYDLPLLDPAIHSNDVAVVLSGTFLVGVEYTLDYVLYDPNYVPDGLVGEKADAILISGANIQTAVPVTSSAVDITRFPNPYSNVSDDDYLAYSRQYRVTITPQYSSGTIRVNKRGYYDSERAYFGVSHVSLKTTYEELDTWYLQKIFDRTGSILNFLNGSLTTLLNSLHSTVSRGFDTLHQDLTSLIGAIGNGLQMTEEDEQDFAEQEAENESFNNSASQKQEQQNQALQQQQQTNQQKQDEVDELEDQRQEFEKIESDFKGSYGGSADFDSINESINEQLTGEYGGAIIWWGEVFGEILSFEPLKLMLNVGVFFGLLMILFGVGTRAGLRVSAREKRTVKHSD